MLKDRNQISMSVIKRLPRYHRILGDLEEKGIYRISSKELSRIMGFTSSQIRQDLNCFGGFGKQGYGYNVKLLKNEISEILGVGRGFKTILIGCGNLGKAVINHMSFDSKGFELIGIFDAKAKEMNNIVVKGISVTAMEDLEIYCQETEPDVAILCLPTSAVQDVVLRLKKLGISNFWNFSHYDINSVFPEAIVENVHLSDSLMTLCYRISNNSTEE